jgi:hypothetical protein
MLRYSRWVISAFFMTALWTPVALAQGYLLPVQQRAAEEERDRQQQREAEQRQAQLDQIREVERRSDHEQHRLAEQQLQAQVAQQQYLVQQLQQAQERQAAEAQTAARDRAQTERRSEVQPLRPTVSGPQETLHQPVGPHWSYRNISNRAKFGLTALAILLIALAFPAGIIPFRMRHR